MHARGPELLLLGLALASLLASLIFGGASAGGGHHSTLIAQLACLPVLGLALWRTVRRPLAAEARAPLILLGAGLLLLLLQLIPLPPSVWTALPGRDMAAQAYAAAAMPAPWLPLSLDPQATLRSLLSLAPGAALFLAALHLGWASRRPLVWALLLAGALNAALGFLQVASGGDFRPYTETTAGAVGVFANRNHSVSLLLAVLPLAGAVAAQATTLRWRGAMLAAVAVVALLATAGLLAGGSRAGWLLLPIAGGGAAVLAASGWLPGGRRAALRAGAAGAALLAVLAATAMVTGAGDRLLQDPERRQLASITLRAAGDFAPLGAGFGTFAPVFQAYEDPDTLQDEFANHAHNDWLELWLEGGWPFAALALAFLAWFARACRRQVRRDASEDAWPLQAAAAVVVLLLLLHSAVDYPLRTSALMAVFGLACGLLVPPSPRSRPATARRMDSGSTRTP